MFAFVSVLNEDASQERIINLSLLEEIRPNGDVTANEATVQSCLARFRSGETITILLDIFTMKAHLSALVGVVDEFGSLT